MNKLIAEFLGTLFLSMAAILSGSPMVTGAVLAVCCYSFGYVSGGHFNPAVSLAIWMRGRMDKGEMLRFMAAQFAGALVASMLTLLLKTESAGTTPAAFAAPGLGRAFLGEFTGTVLLVSAYLHTTTSRALKGNQFYGIAIGLALFAGASLTWGLSRGALNPAAGLAMVVGGNSGASLLPVYLVSCCGAGAVAALLYRFLNPND